MVQTKTFIQPANANTISSNNLNTNLNINNNILDTSIRANLSAFLARPGEQIHLTCSIETPDVTDFVYWYKNKQPIQYDQLRPLSDKLNKLAKLTSNRIPTVKLHNNNNYHNQVKNNRLNRTSLKSSIEPTLLHSNSTLSLGASQLNDTANYTCAVSIETNTNKNSHSIYTL